VALGLFAAALFFPALGLRKLVNIPPTEWVSGLYLLKVGYLGPLAGQIGWYANPLILVSIFWVLRKQTLHPLCLASAAALALSVLVLRRGCVDSCNYIVDFGPGYYLWLSSIALLWSILWADRRVDLEDAVI
jgi:hypothetical protein